MKLNVNPKNSYTFVLHPSHKKLNETIKSVFLLILATFAMVFSSCDGVLFETKEEITIQIYDTYVEEEITKGTTIAPNHGCLIFKAPEESPIEMPLSFELSIDINGTAYTETLSQGQTVVINNIPAGKINPLDLVMTRMDGGSDPLPTTVTVTFNSNGGSSVAPQTFTRGGKATRPEDPTKEQTTFLGWFEDLTNENAFDFNTEINSDKILYAKWEEEIAFHGTAYHELEPGTTGTAGSGWTYVEFGDWPQTIRANNVGIDETESVVVGMFTYYKGSDGAWYAKIKENACESGYKYSDGTTVKQSTAYSYKYFKVEPIKWRVLTNNYSGKRLLLAENILINRAYDIDSNNYRESNIRSWLNGNFYNTAFTSAEQNSIADTNVDNSAASTTDADGKLNQATDYACGNTTDKIFLLSEQEVTKSEYGFAAYNVWIGHPDGTTESTRIHKTTDFAKASGADQQDTTAGYGGSWWLRSPYTDSGYSRGVGYNGHGDSLAQVNNTPTGVVPALTLKN
ncbi:MAG: InlB B-repeat-containing protein [Treponema sp.]|nr:InlB B-repeat-containing protein [Treponema sp.]